MTAGSDAASKQDYCIVDAVWMTANAAKKQQPTAHRPVKYYVKFATAADESARPMRGSSLHGRGEG